MIAALGLDAFWFEPNSLTLVEHPIAIDGSGDAHVKGLRIAVIADLHAGASFIDEDKIRRVVALTNDAKPDLILLGGDYVVTRVLFGRHMPIETIAALLRPLSAPLGVYAVLGNHDHWEDGPHIAAVLAAAHISVLENATRAIATPRGTLFLAGIGDRYTRHDDPSRTLAAVPVGRRALCFTHSPDVFPELPATCLLTIAGHTHGGQVDLPLLGRLIVPSQYGQRYAAGLHREGGKYIFTSTGIGTSIVTVRFRVPPEVSLLRIE